MDALELLTTQHTEVVHLFDKLERHEGEASAKSSIFEQIADDLAAQMTIEEELFYPVAYGVEAEESLRQALDEHRAIKRLLVELRKLSPESPKFDVTLEMLKEELLHHVKKEESDLFHDASKR